MFTEVNQPVAKKVAANIIKHARQGFFTGTWSSNRAVEQLTKLRQVPTNYTSALKADIQTKIAARTNINNAHRKRALDTLNVLFNKKPPLKSK
jgi:hypothetical protein